MNDLNTPENRSTMGKVPFVMFGARIRRIAGLGINAVGAGVLVVEGIRWLSI